MFKVHGCFAWPGKINNEVPVLKYFRFVNFFHLILSNSYKYCSIKNMSLNNSKPATQEKLHNSPLDEIILDIKKLCAEGFFLATEDSPGTPARPSPWSPSAVSLARSRTPPQRESDPQWTRDPHRNRWGFFRIAFLYHFRGLLYERKEEIERGKERRTTGKREKKHEKEPTHLSQTQLCIAWVHLVLSWNLKEAKSSVSLSVYKVLVDSWGIFLHFTRQTRWVSARDVDPDDRMIAKVVIQERFHEDSHYMSKISFWQSASWRVTLGWVRLGNIGLNLVGFVKVLGWKTWQPPTEETDMSGLWFSGW